MADAPVVAMDKEFSRLYGLVGLDVELDLLERRWKGLSELIEIAGVAEIEAMVRICFRSRHRPQPPVLDRIRGAFGKFDDAFDGIGDERELEVLCAAALLRLCRSEQGDGASAALRITTAASGGRPSNIGIDIVGAAEAALDSLAKSARKRPSLAAAPNSQAPKFNLDKAKAKLREQNSWENVAAAFDLVEESVRNGLVATVRQSATLLSKFDKFITIQDEELQFLWWLVGERSWDLGCDFDSVLVGMRPLVFAKELADLTEILPGPTSVKAIFSRAGLKSRSGLTIPAAVNACRSDWLDKLIKTSSPSPVTLPVHFAIVRKLEAGDDESWISNWSAVTGIGAGHVSSPLAVANLFYRERLLVLFDGE